MKLSRAAAVELAAYRALARTARSVLAARLALGATAERRTLLEERLGRWDGERIDRPAAGRGGGRYDRVDSGHGTDRERRPAAARSKAVWLHAASLGEVLAAAPLVARLRATPARVLVTTNTATGRAAALRTGADDVRAFPIDTPEAVDGVLERTGARLFVFVETEIWPSLLVRLAERDIACAMVNACVSERSFRRYGLAQALMSAALGTVAAVCARDEESARRLRALGAAADRTTVVGDLKSDALDCAQVAAVPDRLAAVADDAAVLVAASTHDGEEHRVLRAFAEVRRRHPAARLVLAPRHPERAAAVARATAQAGYATEVWSRIATARRRAADRDGDGGQRAAWDVLVVDTTGELRGFLRSARGAFVGGTFASIGGHNLLEPAAFELPVVCGPSVDGVREQAEALRAAGALSIANDERELAAVWTRWLDAPAEARSIGARGRDVVRARAGALERTMAALAPLLERRPHARRTTARAGPRAAARAASSTDARAGDTGHAVDGDEGNDDGLSR